MKHEASQSATQEVNEVTPNARFGFRTSSKCLDELGAVNVDLRRDLAIRVTVLGYLTLSPFFTALTNLAILL